MDPNITSGSSFPLGCRRRDREAPDRHIPTPGRPSSRSTALTQFGHMAGSPTVAVTGHYPNGFAASLEGFQSAARAMGELHRHVTAWGVAQGFTRIQAR